LAYFAHIRAHLIDDFALGIDGLKDLVLLDTLFPLSEAPTQRTDPVASRPDAI
jgi:hypothetical protein